MSKLSKNFSSEEFDCRCGCGYNVTPQELVDVLQEMRDDLKAPVTINSASRCKQWNEEVGGAKKSQHLLGTAADIVVKGCTPAYVYEYLDKKYPDKYGIGKYKSFTHIDVRASKARW